MWSTAQVPAVVVTLIAIRVAVAAVIALPVGPASGGGGGRCGARGDCGGLGEAGASGLATNGPAWGDAIGRVCDWAPDTAANGRNTTGPGAPGRIIG